MRLCRYCPLVQYEFCDFCPKLSLDLSICFGEFKNHIARQVNGNGGHLEMSTYPDVGSRITLTNFLSAEAAEARVLATPQSREGVSHGIVAELIVPNESFWGVNLQVKKASVELQKLEDSLRSEGIDLRLLNEYRDAVDYIRTAAVVVQQLREHQMHGRSDGDSISLLTTERIRRATNLNLALNSSSISAHTLSFSRSSSAGFSLCDFELGATGAQKLTG